MTQEFFELSETSLKYKRNLMLSSVLCFVHFCYVSFDELKVLNVSIPSDLIALGLPLFTVWFGVNYLYRTVTEFLQWRCQYLRLDKDTPIKNGVWKNWESRSITCEISKLSGGRYSIETKFYGDDGSIVIKGEGEDVKKEICNILANFKAGIKYDVERISRFQSAIKKYSLLNRAKFYLLDVAIPFSMLLLSIFSAYGTLII